MLVQGFLVVIAAVAVCNGVPMAAPKPPSFGNKYHATGFVQLPYAELNEPFEIYYDGAKMMGSLDFYNGMDKTIFRGDEKPTGNMYQINPYVATNTSFKPTTLCFKFAGSKGDMPQSMLPDLTNFTLAGQDLINGRVTDKWMMTSKTYPQKVSNYIFYVSRGAMVVPVRYEMMGYDTLLGSHYDKYVIDYTMFDNKTAFSADVFNLPKGLNCTSMTGVESHIRMNPYQEIINPEKGDRYEEMFEVFKVQHGKTYSDVSEHTQRKTHFTHNVRFIHSTNRQHLGYTLAVNHLADHTEAEMQMMRGRQVSKGYNGGAPFPADEFDASTNPDFIDWRIMGAVTAVKDQAICGSCWSFGAAETIEGSYFIKNKMRMRFSQQNLMDCSWPYGNMGCDGGLESQSYAWIIKNGGLMSEEGYGPYLGQDGSCHYNSSMAAVMVSSYVNVTVNSTTDLKTAIANKGPISVGMDAALKSFSFYSSGVYYDSKCGNGTNDLDHAVLAVGYGSMMVGNVSTDYWIVKNSWSTYWGNNGYVLISQKENNCGIATDATYVVLA